MNSRNFAILYPLLEIFSLQKLSLAQRKTEKKQKFEVETTLIILLQSFFQGGFWVLIPRSLKWAVHF